MGKMTPPASQMLRLNSELWARMSKEAEANKRTPRQEIEWRLKQSLGENLESGSWAAVEPRLTPRARSLIRMLGLLASELITDIPADEDYDYLQRGLSRMLERLSGKELPEPGHLAEMIAEIWWSRLLNAHERTHKNGTTWPTTRPCPTG